MKTRWLWYLLAMPYVVTLSSEGAKMVYDGHQNYSVIACTSQIPDRRKQCQEWLLDEAEALNEAHERRTQKMYVTTDGMKFKSYLDSMNHQSIINGVVIGVKSLPSDNNCADADSHCCTELNGNMPR